MSFRSLDRNYLYVFYLSLPYFISNHGKTFATKFGFLQVLMLTTDWDWPDKADDVFRQADVGSRRVSRKKVEANSICKS